MKDGFRDGLLQYNKNTSDKRRPTIMTSPQERQKQAKAKALAKPIIKDLSVRLEELVNDRSTGVVRDDSGAKLYTEEEVNAAVIKAVTKEMSNKDTTEFDLLVVANAEFEKQLAIQKAVIEELKTVTIKTEGVIMSPEITTVTEVASDRPTIDDSIVVDPSEDVSVETYIDIAETADETTSNRAEVDDKLAKLQALGMGSAEEKYYGCRC